MMGVALAQEAGGAAGAAAFPPLGAFFPFLLILVLFYFLLILPQNKERKKREQMLASIQRGDRVLLRGGIFGTVTDLKDQILTVKIAENTKVEAARAYVETVEKQGS